MLVLTILTITIRVVGLILTLREVTIDSLYNPQWVMFPIISTLHLHLSLATVNFSGKLNNTIDKSGTGVFVEPNLTFKVGFKQFKFFTQFGFSYKVNSSGYNFDYQAGMFSMGAQVTIASKRERNFLK